MHCSRKSLRLRTRRWINPNESTNRQTCLVISSCSSRGKVANVSNFVPIKNGIAVCEEWCEFHTHETSRGRHKSEDNCSTSVTRPRIPIAYDITQPKTGRQQSLTHLVKPPCLSIPLFHRVQRRLSRKVKHEEYGNGIIAN